MSLKAIGSCSSCILRFLSCREFDDYATPEATLLAKYQVSFVDAIQTDPSETVAATIPELSTTNTAPCAPHLSEKICPLCEGILQLAHQDQYIDGVVDEIRRQDYEFPSFTINVSHQFSLQVRAHSSWLYLTSLFPDYFANKTLDEHVTAIKEAYKWIASPKLTSRLLVPFRYGSLFSISFVFENSATVQDLVFLQQLRENPLRVHKPQGRHVDPPITTANIKACLDAISNDNFKKFGKCPPESPSAYSSVKSITCASESIFLAGKYNKYSRQLSQTPWFIDGVRHGETSVEELCTDKIFEKFRAADRRFSSSGREDVDVRMLGDGRPFVIELINPKKAFLSQPLLNDLQEEINASTSLVRVTRLQMIQRQDTKILEEGQESKTKSYKCTVWLSKDVSDDVLDRLNTTKNLQLTQKTPIRVLHRRSLADRIRTIYEMSYVKLKPQFIELTLDTQAGTYVKEFVHGDFGRTFPNIQELLDCEADILCLDVHKIDLDWPPEVPNSDS